MIKFDMNLTESDQSFDAHFGEHTDIAGAVVKALDEKITAVDDRVDDAEKTVTELDNWASTHEKEYRAVHGSVATLKEVAKNIQEDLVDMSHTFADHHERIEAKTNIHNVAEPPQTMGAFEGSRGLYDLYRVSTLVGTLIGVGEVPGTLLLVDALPEIGKPSTDSMACVYYCLQDGLAYTFMESAWEAFPAPVLIITSREQMIEGAAFHFLMDEELSGSKLYALDGKSIKALQDFTLGDETAKPSYIELPGGGDFVERAEFEETLEKAATKINGELETKEEKLELWNDITLTEDVGRLEFYNTDNGEPYQGFRKMYVAIYGKITEGLSTRLRGAVGEAKGSASFLWGATVTYSFNAQSQYACWFAEFERISENAYQSKAATRFFENASADSAMQINQVILYSRKQPLDYYFSPTGFSMTIEKRDTTQEGTPCFLAGTNIKVWGIK